MPPRGRLRATLSGRLLTTTVVTLLAVGALVAGAIVGAPEHSEGPEVPEAGRGQPLQRVSFLARLIPPAPDPARESRGPRVPRSVEDLARRLPLERKVAQLLLVGFKGQDLTAEVYTRLRRFDFGGIVIDRANYTGPQLLGQMAGEARVIAAQEGHVPPLVMAPQEGGEFNAFGDLPPADAAADLTNTGTAGRQAAEAGATLKALGLSGVLAPVIDVGLVDEPVLGGRIYSDDPAEVAGYAESVVRAYRRAGLLAAVKHFPGLGGASQPTEEGPATVGLSLAELRRRDLAPFKAAFEAGAGAVVLSSALYLMDDFTRPGALSVRVATHLLRGELDFRGLALTDDLADPAITFDRTPAAAAVDALKAGADMIFISGPTADQQSALVAILRAVRRKEIRLERIEEALMRVLIAKRRYGLIR